MNLAVNQALAEVVKQHVPEEIQKKLKDLSVWKANVLKALKRNFLFMCEQCNCLAHPASEFKCKHCKRSMCFECFGRSELNICMHCLESHK